MQQSIRRRRRRRPPRRRRRRSELRSKNLFALPPPSPPPSPPFTRYCFTILYYIARYVEFRLFGFNETRQSIARSRRPRIPRYTYLLLACTRIAPRPADPSFSSPAAGICIFVYQTPVAVGTIMQIRLEIRRLSSFRSGRPQLAESFAFQFQLSRCSQIGDRSYSGDFVAHWRTRYLECIGFRPINIKGELPREG